MPIATAFTLTDRERTFVDAVASGDLQGLAASPSAIVAELTGVLGKLGFGAPQPDPRVTITLLGKFSVHRGEVDITPPPGQPSAVLQLVALIGTVHAEVLIDTLWPDAPCDVGRKRLRNVLARLRRTTGPVVIRRDDSLVLAADVEVDATLLAREATEALAIASIDPETAVQVALRATRRFAGDLLPERRFENWSEAPRLRARAHMVALLDLLADRAASQGDVEDAVVWAEWATQLEPLDEHRYLCAAKWLDAAGRRGAAQVMRRRARDVRLELGVE